MKARAGGIAGFWVLWAFLFILRSPSGAFTYDFRGHVDHTRILYNERRLALPREGWETFQPPVYYAVNSFLSPNHPAHAFWVRIMSLVYGSIALVLMSWMLTRCRVAAETQIVVLAFIATTPAFLFMFTTYNNDALATLLSMGILVSAYEWFREKKRWSLWLFGVLSLIGLYTKLTVAYPLAGLMLLLGTLVWARRLVFRDVFPLMAAAGVSVLLLTPWLIGHNYRHTGRLTPTSADAYHSEAYRLPASPLKTILTLPGWTRGEWKDPYAHVWEPTHNKKSSFLAYIFDTSVFGEFTFEFLPPMISWSILLLHGFFWMAAFFRARQSPYGLLSLSLIFVGFACLTYALFRAPFGGFMNFRYAAWTWLPGAVLYGTCLASFPFRIAMISGTFLQGLFWLALVLGGRWNFPP